MYTLPIASRPLSLVCNTRTLTGRLSAGTKTCASIRSLTLTKASEKSSQQNMVRTDAESAAVQDKQARAAEMVVDAAHEKAGDKLSSSQGTPEEIAEEMVSRVDGGDIKSIELERKHAEIIPGQAGSGVQRGSAAAAAQSAVDRASDPSRSSKPKPVIAQKAEAALAEDIQNARE